MAFRFCVGGLSQHIGTHVHTPFRPKSREISTWGVCPSLRDATSRDGIRDGLVDFVERSAHCTRLGDCGESPEPVRFSRRDAHLPLATHSRKLGGSGCERFRFDRLWLAGSRDRIAIRRRVKGNDVAERTLLNRSERVTADSEVSVPKMRKLRRPFSSRTYFRQPNLS